MVENKMSMPGIFGGLMRFDEEYKSRFMIDPAHVLAFVVLIVVFIIVLNQVWPVTPTA